METFFRVTGHLCGEFTGPRWIPYTKASDAEFDVFFDLCLNKQLSKQSWGWWFETPSRPLWRHRNGRMNRWIPPTKTGALSHYNDLILSQAFQPVAAGFNSLRPRQDGRHFADDSFTCIFFNENCCILIKFSLKYVRKGPIDNNRALVQIMAWRRSGDKPLYETMMISLPTHICVTRPQWVKYCRILIC